MVSSVPIRAIRGQFAGRFELSKSADQKISVH
jgi:hypothetical protein